MTSELTVYILRNQLYSRLSKLRNDYKTWEKHCELQTWRMNYSVESIHVLKLIRSSMDREASSTNSPKFVSMKSHSSRVIDGFREQMSSNIDWEAVHEQASEEKARQGRGPASCPF